MKAKKFVTYEDFGAVGYGKTEDFDAIKRAHEYANENGLDVVCEDAKTYYIGIMTKTIPIKTPNVTPKTVYAATICGSYPCDLA